MKFLTTAGILLLTFAGFFAWGTLLNTALGWASMPNDTSLFMGIAVFATSLSLILAWFHTYAWDKSLYDKAKPLGLVFALMFLSGCACSMIEPGHVGIVVDKIGEDKGVQSYTQKTGWVFYSPVLTGLFEYPTSVQTTQMNDITVNSKEGTVFEADVFVAYQLDAIKVPDFYVKFRSDDLDTFTHGYLRNTIRQALNTVTKKYSQEQVYADKTELIFTEALKLVNDSVVADGVIIEQLGPIGAVRPPESIITAINAKAQAVQLAMQTENELRTAQAEAQKSIATADGEAKSVMLRATAEARANTLLSQSLTPQLVLYEAVKRWDGVRPTVEGTGSGLLLNLNTSRSTKSPD